MPRFERVSYTETYEVERGFIKRTWHKAHADILLDAGDDPKAAMKAADDFVNGYLMDKINLDRETAAMEVPEVQKPKEEAQSSIIEDINSCTELKVLEAYKLIAKSNPEFQKAYDLKLKQLQPC